MLWAAAWLSAMRFPLTWQRMVRVPDTLVTKVDSPKPISRTRWQNSLLPVSSRTRPLAPAGSWQSGRQALKGEDATDIQAKAQTLAQASMKLGEAMYSAQQSGGDQSGGDAGGSAEGGEKKEDVVDAEFTEVDDKKKSA